MISFNNLGYMGRLGNQMFQYAALKGIATHKGYWYSIPENNSLIEHFKIVPTLSNQNSQSVYEETFEFSENIFNACPDDVDLVGYFQTEKYFKHIEEHIRRDFTFNDRTYKICCHYRNSVSPNTELISLHVRRADYLTDSKFHCLPFDYYYDALNKLPEVPVMVFSDDTEWCKKAFTNRRFIISTSGDLGIDLCLMSLCNYHIIANSSFSWWGAWLAKSQKTIAPKKWFDGELSHYNTKDLYLPEWNII